MSETGRFIGIQPRFPGAVGRWGWLVRPVAAERVAALRIALALTLLVDLAAGLLPYFATLYSADALGGSFGLPGCCE